MRRQIRALLLAAAAAVSALPAAGCGETTPQEDIDRWEQQAQVNAKAYIAQRYGVDAEVTAVKADWIQGMFSIRSISDVFVDMRAGTKEFTVYISGDGECTEGYDSFQADMIERALCDLAETCVPGVQRMTVDANSPTESKHETQPLYCTYYDGSNLAEIFAEQLRGFTAFYQQADLSDDDAFAPLAAVVPENDWSYAQFVSCRSENALAQNDHAAMQPIYCDSIRKVAWLKNSYETYEIHEYGNSGIYWYAKPLPATSRSSEMQAQIGETEPPAPEVTITPADTPDISVFYGWGAGKKAAASTPAYHVEFSNTDTVRIYYPQSGIEHFSDSPLYITDTNYAVLYTGADGTQRNYARSCTAVGNYVVFSHNAEQSRSFTFLYLYDP